MNTFLIDIAWFFGILLICCFIFYFLKENKIRRNRVNFILKIIAGYLKKKELVRDVVFENAFCSQIDFCFYGDHSDLFLMIEEKFRLLGFNIFCYKKLSDGLNFEVRCEDKTYYCDIFWGESGTCYSMYLG